MASTHGPVATPDPEIVPEPPLPGSHRSPGAFYRYQIAVLCQQVATLQTALEHERKQRQAVVDRYERVLDDR